MSQGNTGRAVGDTLNGFERLVTQERVNAYAEASGDHNPIHLDEAYASKSQFGTRIAHGMLSRSRVDERFRTGGPDSWRSGDRLMVRFTDPILPGETVHTYGEITSIDVIRGETGDVRVATCTVGCKKPDGTDAVSGRATVPLE